MQDIYDGVLSYLHDGSDAKNDSLEVQVSDSTNTGFINEASLSEDVPETTLKSAPPTSVPPATTQPATVMVEVAAVESGAPILRVNRGLTFLQQEKGKVDEVFISVIGDGKEGMVHFALVIDCFLFTFLFFVRDGIDIHLTIK